MKAQHYRVTEQGPAIPLPNSVKQADYDAKKSEGPIPQRYNQEAVTGTPNKNLNKNYQIGQDIVSLRGNERAAEVQQRQHTTYNTSAKGQFSYQFRQNDQLNKGLHDFVLANKFEYGYGQGGRHFASTETKHLQKVEEEAINSIVSNIGKNYEQSAANKANDAKQNFDIKPVGQM